MQQPAISSSPSPNPAVDQAAITVEELRNPPGEDTCQYDQHALFMSLAPKPVPYVQRQDGKTHSSLYRAGDMLITPAGTPLKIQWQAPEHGVAILLSDGFLRQVARETMGDRCDRTQLIPEFQIRHPQLEAMARLLHSEAQQGGTGSQLYLDSMANVVALHLLRHHTTTRPQLVLYEGGLPPRQLQQVLDYIESHLDQNLKLETLAQLLDMSQFHFSRLFKQSMGASPYRYLIAQRVERAKLLLKGTDKPITDIAFDCGFNSHSHLSKQFRQVTGMTPKGYRSS